ncbi:MAG: RecQ family ATP-dependent DNA helicase [Bacteroidia bacterium]|nr:RecQ family ATP-dependent DNA helicase [Bacteroidia bacterium]
MTEFFAGHILQGVAKNIENSVDKNYWFEIATNLSKFYCQNPTINNSDNESEHPILSVLDNQISRGLPTISSIFIEREFERIFNLTSEKTNEIGTISFDLKKSASTDFLKCLVIADSRTQELNSENTYNNWEEHGGSQYEKDFFINSILRFGDNTNQLLQLQRTMASVVGSQAEDLFMHQNIDFLIQLPKSEGFRNGVVIEIDGQQHKEPAQSIKDQRRDFFADQNNFDTIRIWTNEVNNLTEIQKNKISAYFQHPYIRTFKQNIEKPLFYDEIGMDYLQLYLSPFGISRVQKAFLKALKSGIKNKNGETFINAKTLNIAIIERDIPCGKIAIDDLLLQIKHLSILQNENGEELQLPNLEITIFNTLEFANAKLNADNNCQIFNANSDFRNYDLVIDISILNYSTFLNRPTQSLVQNTIVIRSIHHTEYTRTFNFHKFIKYENAPENKEDDRTESLNFFLQSFFRKTSFREGQIEILSKALQKRNPIALLPTGAGKSLTYQVASLLQAGLIIVVDPIKALMKDQNENLKNVFIDATTYINSTLSAKEKEANTNKFVNGNCLFAFVSPERFVINDFRTKIGSVRANSRNFAFCVIDEAHCVSEWGHDFRTAYLKLGDNSRIFCFSGHNGENIPTLGLTGTASFDVLSDVQREVGLQNNSDIIRPEKLERKELKFKIKNITAINIGAGNNFWTIYNSVFEAKKQGLLNILQNDLISEPHLRECNAISFSDFIKYQGNNSNCGIIFCPYSGTGNFGVQHIATYLRQQFPDVAHLIGEYYGSGDSASLEQVQDDFKSNKITLLVATKAFGMGIDKPNIRFTLHITHPISIEGFYQEAGRAGRDRKNAVCYILHCNNLLVPNSKGKMVSVARNIQDTFLFNSFKGGDYEKSITVELLDRITFPHTSNKDQTQDDVFSNLGKEIKLSKPWPSEFPTRIYISGAEFGQKYGFIFISNLQISTQGNNMCSDIEALNLLNTITKFVKNNNPKNLSLIDWLQNVNITPEKQGVEFIISKIPINQTNVITIGLENNGVQQVLEYLNQYFNPLFDYSLVKNSTNYCQSDNDFIINLETNYRRTYGNVITFSAQQTNDLKVLFKQVRQEQDTFKIIYRLSILGVVKDYTIDYGAKSINAICQNQTAEEIYQNLYTHFRRYYPENYVTSLMQNARNGSERTALRNSINTLIDFTYDNVFSKRETALNNMTDTIEKAISETIKATNLGKSKQEAENIGNAMFLQTVNDYFDSRFVDEIRDVTEFGSKLDFSVFEYFSNKAINNDQLRQLENSARRSLESYNKNPVISLLQYYSATMINNTDNSALLSRTKDIYIIDNGFPLEEFDKILNQVENCIKEKDVNSLANHHKNIQSVLSKQVLNHFVTINKKILKEYV